MPISEPIKPQSKPASPVSPATPEKPKKRTWLAALGINSFVLSLAIHLLFGVGATYLIVQHFQKKHVQFRSTEPPAPQQVEHKVQLQKRNNVESAPPDLKRIVTTDVSPITLPEPPDVPTPDVTTPSPMAGVDGTLGEGMGSGGGGGGGGGGGIPLFGLADGIGLKGTLYDLKQTTGRHDSGLKYDDYYAQLRKYVEGGWNNKFLDRYYKSQTQLFATRFAIPMVWSKLAPEAFKVQNEVKPSYWAVHYEGTVVAPESGNYRLMGYGDNLLVVRMDHQIVLDAGWNLLLPKRPDLSHHLPLRWLGDPQYPKNAEMKMGPQFRVEGGQPIPMEVLIGDDGGSCGFYLFLMKEGTNYDKAPDGTPKLPFFQIGDGDPPTATGKQHYPPFSPDTVPWQDGGKN